RSVALDAGTGEASLGINSIGPGPHLVMASFAGDSNFESRKSNAVELAVSTAGTQSILIVQVLLSKQGRVVAVVLPSAVLVVAPGSGVPLGTVRYFRNGHKLKAKSLANGAASVKLPLDQALNKSFLIKYGGEPNFGASSSASLVITRRLLRMSAPAPTAYLSVILGGRGR